MNEKVYRNYATLVSLSVGCLFLPSAINLVIAEPGIINKIVDPLKAIAIIRARVLEGIELVAAPKAEIMTNALSTAELSATASSWNAQANGSGALNKYVSQVQIDSATGEIEIMFNENNVGAITPSSTLVFTPYVQAGGAPMQLASALTYSIYGNLDWGCASSTNAVSAGQSLPAIRMGTLEPQYAPMECR